MSDFEFHDMALVPARDLQRDPNNPRQDWRGLDSLRRSIEAAGCVVEPLVITPERIIIEGNMRHKCVEDLGWFDDLRPGRGLLRVIVYRGDPDIIRMLAPRGRTRLTPHDEGEYWERAMRNGRSISEIALWARTTPGLVARRIKALHLMRLWGLPRKGLSLCEEALRIEHVVPLERTKRMIDSGHVRRAQDVRRLPVIFLCYRRPWLSPKTLLELYESALRRRGNPA